MTLRPEDRAARIALAYDQYAAGLYRYAVMVLGDQASAADAVRQVFAAWCGNARPLTTTNTICAVRFATNASARCGGAGASVPSRAHCSSRSTASVAALSRLAEELAPLDREHRLSEEFVLTRALMLDEHRADRAVWSSPMRTWRVHMLVWALDQYAALARAAEQPWPEPLEAVPARAVVPTSGQRMTIDRGNLEVQAKSAAQTTKRIRCARLRVSGGALKLVDPFSGRFLELADCKL